MVFPRTASIALCTFNGAAYLGAQLASIADQLYRPNELVICDDGSTDATCSIIESFAASAPFPVRFVRNRKRLGYRANFMQAEGLCEGDVVFFCDQDDLWLPDKIDHVMRAFDDPSIVFVYHNALLVDERNVPDGRLLFDGAEQRRILGQQPLAPWHYTLGFTQAFRRGLSSFDALWPQTRDHLLDAVLAHDQWFIFLAALVGRIAFIDEPLVRHRQHGANTYGVVDRSRWNRLRSRFVHRPEWDRLAANAARARAEIADVIADQSPSNAEVRLRLIAAGYRDLAVRHERREASYTLPTIVERAWSMGKALWSGDYRGGTWGLGPKAAMRDLIAGPLRAGRP